MSLRRVRLSVAMSLDGFIAGPNGEYDWIPEDPEMDMPALFKDFDTVLMGRKSYEMAKRDGHLGMFGLPTIVFSSSLRQEDHAGVTIARDPAETVRELRSQPGKDLWLFGGGELFRSFLDLNLVDEMDVAVIPILLGAGLPLLPGPTTRAKLRLLTHRLYRTSGIAFCTYAVEGAALARTP